MLLLQLKLINFTSRAFTPTPLVYNKQAIRKRMTSSTIKMMSTTSTDDTSITLSISNDNNSINRSFLLTTQLGYLLEANNQLDTATVSNIARPLVRQYSPQEILSAAHDIAQSKVSALVNACIAFGLDHHDNDEDNTSDDDREVIADLAAQWLELFQSGDTNDIMKPDIVTYACIASACAVSENNNFHQSALTRTVDALLQMSKKAGGTSRRKALAAAKRLREKTQAPEAAHELLKGKFNIEILFENDDILCVNKPTGMLCHQPAGGKKRKGDTSLEDALAQVGIQLSSINPAGRGIVHRLDRGASGCLVVAKNDITHCKLVKDFYTRKASKHYSALVAGDTSSSSSSEENVGCIEDVVNNKPAISYYTTERVFGDGIASLIKVKTVSGRKHQVRVHLAKKLNTPIFLDPIYYKNETNSTKKKKNKKGTDVPNTAPQAILDAALPAAAHKSTNQHEYRFFLHCSELSLPSFKVKVEASFPEWWENAIENL